MQHNRRKEIIVYLDYHSKVANGEGDLILDFRRLKDFNNFAEAFSGIYLNGTSVGTYLRITGYRTRKRLMRGCYYSLNVELLKKARLEKITDSYLFLAAFHFATANSKEWMGQELLLLHEPLDASELYWDYRQNPQNINLPQGLDPLQLYVADVGQANWNELRLNGATIVQYDMGAELNATRQQVDAVYKARRQRIDARNKAILIISHWDIDHIHGLCAMTDDDIRNTFRLVVCPNVMRSNTARRILLRLSDSLTPARIYCISPYRHVPHTDYHVHPVLSRHNMALYIGEHRRNLNHSGIVLMVKGNTLSVNFTGDCLLSQAEEARRDAVQGGLYTDSHVLVVPHHGGTNEKKYMQYNTLSPRQQTTVCISVGRANQYGHPDAVVLNYLHLISAGNVMRTDHQGDIAVDL